MHLLTPSTLFSCKSSSITAYLAERFCRTSSASKLPEDFLGVLAIGFMDGIQKILVPNNWMTNHKTKNHPISGFTESTHFELPFQSCHFCKPSNRSPATTLHARTWSSILIHRTSILQQRTWSVLFLQLLGFSTC